MANIRGIIPFIMLFFFIPLYAFAQEYGNNINSAGHIPSGPDYTTMSDDSAENERKTITIGAFSFFITTKIIEDGSILDIGLDWEYTGRFGGGIEFNRTKIGYKKILGFERLPECC